MSDCFDGRSDEVFIRWVGVWMDGGMFGWVFGWMSDWMDE
jgi:hypothetical protein